MEPQFLKENYQSPCDSQRGRQKTIDRQTGHAIREFDDVLADSESLLSLEDGVKSIH